MEPGAHAPTVWLPGERERWGRARRERRRIEERLEARGQRGRARDGGRRPYEPRREDSLLPFASGTFTRSTEASLETSPGVVAWYGVNVPRIRFDGMWLFEGGSTNLLPNPEAINLWSGGTATSGSVVAPDGEADADIITFAAAANSRSFVAVSLADSTDYALSGWGKGAPDLTGTLVLVNKAGGYAAGRVAFALHGTNWQRATTVSNSGTGVSSAEFRVENSPGTSIATVHAWGMQLEALPFATSYSRLGTSTARGADRLTFTSGQIPSAITSGRWQFDFVSLIDSAVNIGATPSLYLVSPDGAPNSDGVFLEFDGSMRIGWYSSGTSTVLQAVSFSAGQKCTVSLDFAAGTMTLSGFTTGDGTYNASGGPGQTWDVANGLGIGFRKKFSDRNMFAFISEPRAW